MSDQLRTILRKAYFESGSKVTGIGGVAIARPGSRGDILTATISCP
jgi:hypothetical protein